MRNITLRQLRAASAIGRACKIVTAARELSLTPPAVTQQLQQLEESAGCALFDRTNNGLFATQAGEVVLETAAQVWSLISDCEDRLAALNGLTAGRLTVGVVSTAKYFSPRLIAGFSERHGGVDIRIVVGNREEMIDRLADFEVDVAIMGRPPKDHPVEAVVFGDHPLVVIAPPNHRLAERRSIRKEELTGEVLLMREEGSGTRLSMQKFIGGMRLAGGRPMIEMGSNETIKQAVMAGLGIAFISGHTIEAELESGRLVTLQVRGLPVQRQWFGVRRQDKASAPTVAAFVNFLKEEGARYLPQPVLKRTHVPRAAGRSGKAKPPRQRTP